MHLQGQRKKNGMNPHTDGACMIDEGRQAMKFALGAGLHSLNSPIAFGLIIHVFNSNSYKTLYTGSMK